MKKITLIFAACIISLSAMAEGYQVNSLSAKQNGMGHVGTAMKIGAESMHFNPAGMAFMDKTLDLSAGISAMFTKARFKDGDYRSKTDNPTGTPLYFYAGMSVYDWLKLGFSFTTPYGSSLKWPHNWKGADLIQEISLKSYQFQPTVAIKLMDNLSIGGGLMLAWGDVRLNRGMFPPGVLTSISPVLFPADKYGDVIPASAELHGETSVRVGVNVGAMYDINDQWTVGVSFRSKITMKVHEGTAKIEYSSESIKNFILNNLSEFPELDKGKFKAELPLPANLTFGATYKPMDNLLLSADFQWTFWSAYEELNVKFSENVLGGYNINAYKNYHNSIAARIGAQYGVTDRCDLRAGVYFDESPVRKYHYNPETPSMNKIGLSIGGSFRPLKHFEVSLAAVYIAGISREGYYTAVNAIKQEATFGGHYKSNAYYFTLGVGYSF